MTKIKAENDQNFQTQLERKLQAATEIITVGKLSFSYQHPVEFGGATFSNQNISKAAKLIAEAKDPEELAAAGQIYLYVVDREILHMMDSLNEKLNLI